MLLLRVFCCAVLLLVSLRSDVASIHVAENEKSYEATSFEATEPLGREKETHAQHVNSEATNGANRRSE